jgi:hypothetical protein
MVTFIGPNNIYQDLKTFSEQKIDRLAPCIFQHMKSKHSGFDTQVQGCLGKLPASNQADNIIKRKR